LLLLELQYAAGRWNGYGENRRESGEREEKLSVVLVTLCHADRRWNRLEKTREIEWRKRDETLGSGDCSFDICVAESLIGYGEERVEKETVKAYGHVCYCTLL
jgi:hypothetical protein